MLKWEEKEGFSKASTGAKNGLFLPPFRVSPKAQSRLSHDKHSGRASHVCKSMTPQSIPQRSPSRGPKEGSPSLLPSLRASLSLRRSSALRSRSFCSRCSFCCSLILRSRSLFLSNCSRRSLEKAHQVIHHASTPQEVSFSARLFDFCSTYVVYLQTVNP